MARVGRLVHGVDRAATRVSLRSVLTNRQRVAVIQRPIQALVHHLRADPSWFSVLIWRAVHVAVPTLAGVLLRTRHLTADGRRMAIILCVVHADRRGLDADASWLSKRVR